MNDILFLLLYINGHTVASEKKNNSEVVHDINTFMNKLQAVKMLKSQYA